tara:strand:+ start:68 stop:322 length:255 start_codon:yes stop_codon:yes gene_type:complete
MENEFTQALGKKFMNPAKFALEIEKLVKQEGINYIDAIVLYCEENNIEIDSITKLISKPLKEKLKCDAQQLNFMKKTTRAKLPL